MKGICFFSYSKRHHVEKQKELLDYLCKALNKQSKIQIIYDEKSFKISDNFRKEESRIIECDTVVVFFTPDYKKAVQENDGSREIVFEYDLIIKGHKNGTLKVIPVLVDGSVETAVTKDFDKVIVADFSESKIYVEGRGKRKRINSKYKNELSNLIDVIIDETITWNRRKEIVYSDKNEEYNALFHHVDSSKRLPRQCMYSSFAYNMMMERDGGILVGKKGTGKTTFFDVLENFAPEEFDKKYKCLRPISVEDIGESILYQTYRSVRSDHGLLNNNRIIDLFWEIYIYLTAIYIVCIENEYHRIHDDRKTTLESAAKILKQAFNIEELDSEEVRRAIFTESHSLWDEFVKKDILDHATEQAYMASIVANFSVDNILEKLFGKRCYRKICRAIERCDKKIIVALDRFDRLSEDFRMDTCWKLSSDDNEKREEGQFQSQFDCLLFRELVGVIGELKRRDTGVMSRVVFCIILPQDRLDQIKLIDRDFVKHSFSRLSWDAIELIQVVLMRMAFINDDYFDDTKSIETEYFRIMKRCLPLIPKKLSITYDGEEIEIGLLQYILRVSFWKPREIIKYFALLIETNKDYEKKGEEIPSSTIKSLINATTEAVVNEQFFEEYKYVFYNIQDFLDLFSNLCITLETGYFIEVIRKFDFRGPAVENRKLEEIMGILYQMGIYGLKIRSRLMNERNIAFNTCFVFNEGMGPYNKLQKNVLKGDKTIEIVLNPVFAKRLSLHYKSAELICDYDWKYLDSNHARKRVIDRI